MKTIAIMQPTFLPWIGYFSLIERVDEFIFLDHVQFDKRSWQQRNKIKTTNGPQWLSVPVTTKGRSEQAIKDVEILYEGEKNPLLKLENSIAQNYSKARFYDDYAPKLFDLFATKTKHLATLNESVIRLFCNELGINTPFKHSSSMNIQGTKDLLLVDICKNVEATHYISPPGSKAYLEESTAFADNNIELSYHHYNHPEYAQLHGDFIPYLCIFDLLANEGANSMSIINEGLNT